ncbi:MAG TPA: hypothetical protein VHR45_08855 [Thermoanaerobaculia bacterium]|nr:hypothetical protein [Thermoanaerobaculia bacterium]
MIAAEAALTMRARRAYEHGRLRWALRRATLAAAVSMVALAGCPAYRWPVVCATALGAAVAAFLWRGGAWARGARLGFLAGLAPCLLPAALRCAHAYGRGFCLTLPVVCLAAGAVTGLVLGSLGSRVDSDRRFWAAAASVAVLAGTIGAVPAGLAGLAGLAAGILGGAAAPVLASRAA